MYPIKQNHEKRPTTKKELCHFKIRSLEFRFHTLRHLCLSLVYIQIMK